MSYVKNTCVRLALFWPKLWCCRPCSVLMDQQYILSKGSLERNTQIKQDYVLTG